MEGKITTPIWNFLCNYAKENFARFHMPGHKGRVFSEELSAIFPYDITEIKGADSLFEANSIICESEQNATRLFGTEKTIYSTGGSTLCIQTMLKIASKRGETVIAGRNSHRAFLNACVLLDLDIKWLYPETSTGILSCDFSMEQLENALQDTSSPCCVYVTSPDYLGRIADILTISGICKKHNIPLLVDNAHGVHLKFLENSLHPMDLGADMCCDSAHKMLPALTGAAYLHINSKRFADDGKSAMSLFASTSPSYLIMASLDLCNRYISDDISKDLRNVVARISILKNNISIIYTIIDSEPLRISIDTSNRNYSGNFLAEKLRQVKIECEYSDDYCLVLLCSPISTAEELDHLERSLMEINPSMELVQGNPITLPQLKKEMPVREATLCNFKEIPIEESVGKICSCVNVPCPPAIPIIVSGEVISSECINIFKNYGIRTVNVVE